jgi:hypothetical protein
MREHVAPCTDCGGPEAPARVAPLTTILEPVTDKRVMDRRIIELLEHLGYAHGTLIVERARIADLGLALRIATDQLEELRAADRAMKEECPLCHGPNDHGDDCQYAAREAAR